MTGLGRSNNGPGVLPLVQHPCLSRGLLLCQEGIIRDEMTFSDVLSKCGSVELQFFEEISERFDATGYNAIVSIPFLKHSFFVHEVH